MALQTRVFQESDIYVDQDADESHQRPWNKREPSLRNNLYIGQLKLLASELFFIQEYSNDDEPLAIVYAGAAGGHHIPALARMYPDIKFYLYDPAPFAITEDEENQIHIINGFFTDEIAREWGKQKDYAVIFICDIRTCGDTPEEKESEIEENMAMQARWVELLLPSLQAYSLKFRIPYTIIEAKQSFSYLGGKLIYQPFAKPDSMEMRLLGVPSDVDKSDYDSESLEKILFYHNSVERPSNRLFYNLFTGTNKPYNDPQFDRGYDCTYLLFCLCQIIGRGKENEDEVLATARDMIRITSKGHWTLAQKRQRSLAMTR